jgi:hypothetical protein
MAAAVGGAGVVTVAVHGVLLLAGRTEFSTWPSLALLALVAVAAPALLAATARARARAGSGAP